MRLHLGLDEGGTGPPTFIQPLLFPQRVSHPGGGAWPRAQGLSCPSATRRSVGVAPSGGGRRYCWREAGVRDMGGSRQQTEGPSARPLTQPQFPELQSVLQGWAGHDWPYTQTRRPSDVRNRMLSLCSKIPSSLADHMRRSTVLSLEGGTCPRD